MTRQEGIHKRFLFVRLKVGSALNLIPFIKGEALTCEVLFTIYSSCAKYSSIAAVEMSTICVSVRTDVPSSEHCLVFPLYSRYTTVYHSREDRSICARGKKGLYFTCRYSLPCS